MNNLSPLKSFSPYNAAITREQFMFYETRTTAKLLSEGMCKKDVIEKIVQENLFQFPTEKSIRQLANCCIRRLEGLKDDSLVQMIAS